MIRHGQNQPSVDSTLEKHRYCSVISTRGWGDFHVISARKQPERCGQWLSVRWVRAKENRSEITPVSLRRGQALLAYLASKETRRENREVLLDMLWPDRFKEQAQASLRQVIFELKALAPADAPFCSLA
jgi:hypothetical protein